MPTTTAPPEPAAIIAQSLDAVVGLVKLTATLAAERDRYREALLAIANSRYGECSYWALQRLAEEALASREATALP